MTRPFSLAVIAAILLAPAVRADDSAGVEFFEKRIRPLLVEHCDRCHSAKSDKVKGHLLLDSREAILKGGDSGPALVPGKPAESLLLKAVRYDTELRMPPKAKLDAAQIADLEAWIKMGAPDPRDGKPAVVAAPKSTVDLVRGKDYWAFRPLAPAKPPPVRDSDWPLSDIDRFILARIEAKGLKPGAAADRHTLLRRATYDLTGLPPTPEEIAAFVKDESHGAFAKVVDRLLASRAYGERWGRHWLDVVRYADTAGDNSDYPIPQMVKYRDWVIRAVNDDMPYDRFVREQIAGDLMPAESDGDRQAKLIATGYLANSRRHGSYEDERYPWHLTIEDTLDNFGKAFLGLTLGCARCHDHKFDPLTADDYYALYGFFSSTRYPWPGIELDKVPKDLVPLAPGPEVERTIKERADKIMEIDEAIKTLEAGKKSKEEIQAAKKEREKLAKEPLPFEVAYAVIDGKNEPKKRIGQVGDVRLQMKGDPAFLGKTVHRRFPTILGGQSLPADAKGSGRLELATWLTDPSNPLVARVMVNRIWQGHFGRGIVSSANNFGKQGRPPTHPALLDHLAKEFVAGGWSVKRMHRRIMLSRAYQISSADDDANAKLDPNNDLIWKFGRHRLDAESIRDTLLAVSGNLDPSSGGPHPFPEQATWNFTQHNPFKAVYPSNRRSVYLMTQRIQRHPFLALFDGPDTNASTASRDVSTTPLQALFLMNNPFVHEQAKKLAARVMAARPSDEARVEYAFLLVYGRPPTPVERRDAMFYLTRLEPLGRVREETYARPWESLVRALFMTNEFVYVN